MIKKNFTTLFHDNISEVNLFKAEIQIPYNIMKVFNCETNVYYVKKKNIRKGTNKEITDFNGMEISKLKNIKIFFINFHMIYFLLVNSKKIDILHLMHFKPSVLYGVLYKLLNKNGKLYVTMDFNSKIADSWYIKPTNLINKIIFSIIKLHAKNIDCISTETDEGVKVFTDYLPELKEKIIHMPYGISLEYFNQYFPYIKNTNEKENIIINPCRIGSSQKNTEMILNALDGFDLKDWKFYLIGPIEDSFKVKITEFQNKNSQLIDKVIFTGPIYDKIKLYDFFNRAKVYCLTSYFESFNVCLPEALYFGNYLLLTDVSGSDDVLVNNDFGEKIAINDYLKLKESLQNIVNGDIKFYNSEYLNNFAKNNYNREILIKRIGDKLNLTNV